MLMPGIPPVKLERVGRYRLKTPRIVGSLKHGGVVCIGQGYDTAQMIRMGIINPVVLTGLFDIHRRQSVAAGQIVQLPRYSVFGYALVITRKQNRFIQCSVLLLFGFPSLAIGTVHYVQFVGCMGSDYHGRRCCPGTAALHFTQDGCLVESRITYELPFGRYQPVRIRHRFYRMRFAVHILVSSQTRFGRYIAVGTVTQAHFRRFSVFHRCEPV
ncbi:hypothetical protein Barb6_02054 [Bacteroidales bacterium Barb6]|nr:hypothetical protein Barb6_02054 [Bacteroidales bacterium Barb6]